MLSSDKDERKNMPMATGLLDYFPDALAYVAYVSKVGNDQHNPGQPLHWAKEKSTDHADCLVRHFIDRGTNDTDNVRHTGKVAWRALALLQTEIEKEREAEAYENELLKLVFESPGYPEIKNDSFITGKGYGYEW